MDSSQKPDDPLRTAAIRRLLEERDRQLAHGDYPGDAALIRDHPELLPELVETLRTQRVIRRALKEANRIADIGDDVEESPVELMTDSQLGASLEVEHLPSAADPAFNSSSTFPQFAGYTLHEVLGIGGQGTVYKARQDSTGRTVAVKVLGGGPFRNSRQRERFERETKILAKLDHPGVVPILDRGRTVDQCVYFVMPFINGRDFKSHLASLRESREYATIVRLFAKLGEAIGEAHRHGIVHRDLKPSNVLVTERGEPIVLDFGLARPNRDFSADDWHKITVTEEGQIVGSIPWASPEQVSGAPIDVRTDVYSLGVMFHEGLTGEFPYPTTGGMLISNIVHARPTVPSRYVTGPPTHFLNHLDAVTSRALSKVPTKRYPDAAAMAKDLRRIESGKRPSAFDLRRRASVSWRRWRIAIAVTVVALVSYSVWHVKFRVPDVAVIRLPSFTNSIGVELLKVPGGQLLAGSPITENGRDPTETQQRILLPAGFFLSRTEITCKQYRDVMGSLPAACSPADDNLPARGMTWNDAVEFCRRLSEREPGRTYRLPDEAEWELACRAGAIGAFSGTARADSMAWHQGTSGMRVQPVRQLTPNHWGFFDMHGNVAEFCRQPLPGRSSEFLRPVRGGSYDLEPRQCRSAYRQAVRVDATSPSIGFRVLCEVAE